MNPVYKWLFWILSTKSLPKEIIYKILGYPSFLKHVSANRKDYISCIVECSHWFVYPMKMIRNRDRKTFQHLKRISPTVYYHPIKIYYLNDYNIKDITKDHTYREIV